MSQELYEEFIAAGHEGVVCKRRSSRYYSGATGESMDDDLSAGIGQAMPGNEDA